MIRWLHLQRMIIAVICLFVLAPLSVSADTRGGALGRNVSRPAQADQSAPPEMPSGTLQHAIDGANAGSIVYIQRGIYRETVTIDKPLTLIGESGAEIRGSDIWSGGWERRGDHWYRAGAASFETTGEWCRDDSNGRCNWPHQVFRDGAPLYQVEDLPAPGQFSISAGREVVLADDPDSAVIEVTMRRAWILTASDGVAIRGFTMQHAADRPHEGALSNAGYSDWVVQENLLLHAHMAVISIREAGNLRILDNQIAFGGRMGIHGWLARETQISRNTVHSNNTEDFEGGWEAGGMKLSGLSNSSIRENDVHSNNGAGIWCDVGCNEVTIAGNRVHDNRRYGILYEISRAGQILDNQIWENGWGFTDWGFGAGFVCQNCRDTEVAGNVVAWNADGISIMSQNRDGYTDVVNNDVHDNVIILTTDWSQNTYMLAWLEDWPGRLTDASSSNRGADNSYFHAAPEGAFLPFSWGQYQRFGLDDLAGFNATPGEEGGHLISGQRATEILAEHEMPREPMPRP